jgi:hypothetical protein
MKLRFCNMTQVNLPNKVNRFFMIEGWGEKRKGMMMERRNGTGKFTIMEH